MVFNRKLAEFLKCHDIPAEIIMHDFFVLQAAAIFGRIVYDDRPMVRYRQHEKNVLGIKTGFWQRLNRWAKAYLGKPKVSNARHLQSVLEVFADEIPEGKREKNQTGSRLSEKFEKQDETAVFSGDCCTYKKESVCIQNQYSVRKL